MNYNEAMEFIHSTYKFGSKPGLDRIKALMNGLDNPQNKLEFVHVAGTNGKGSTSAFLNSILCEAGYKVGLYTSPSLFTYNERIRVNSENISDNDWARIAEQVKIAVDDMYAKTGDHPTEFEIITAMAMLYFVECGCDIVVLEVGLGGRFDATNIIPTPKVAVITRIGFDHTEYLGNTLCEIASNKAGIIKDGCEVVLYSQESIINNTILEECNKTKSHFNEVSFDKVKVTNSDINGQVFDFDEYKAMEISMLGGHQINNACVAITAATKMGVSKENIRTALKKTKWAGRLEVVNKKPLIIIDGAHNINGTEALAISLEQLFKNQKITFVTGILADKEYSKMIELIKPMAKRFITVTPDTPRALSAKDLANHIETKHGIKAEPMESVKEALEYAISTAEQDEIICAFGSLYYLADVRAYFNLF